MSYLVLARKLRPQTFEQVVGQTAVVRTLQNAIKKKRVAHAMLFSGVRGTGKTTLARIMAKAINCENPDYPPCNNCPSCKDITDGNSIDLTEIDGASNRGIQEIRELKENIRFQPARSRYKIIIIDEVHMLTMEAFNALLKTLEEPPSHVFFMFATTELHKVPVTILSRCQRYELKRVSSRQLIDFFKKIAVDEGVDISNGAVEMIAREAGGSVRDGLSLLDQIFSFGGDKVEESDVTEVLGIVDSRVFIEIATALLRNDLARCLEMLEGSYSQGIDLKRFAVDLLSCFRSLIITKEGGECAELIDGADQDLAQLQEIASQHSVQTMTSVFHLLLKGVEEMQYSSQPKMVLEVAFMKIVAVGDVVPASTLLERLMALLKSEGGLEAISAVAVPVKEPATQASLAPRTSSDPPKGEETRPSLQKEISEPEKKEVVVSAEQAERPAKNQEAVESSAVRLQEKEVRKHWEGFVAHVKERKAWMAHALSLCHNAREDDHELVLKYADASECKILQVPENIKLLTEFALDFFQKDLKVSIIAKSGKLSGEQAGDQNQPQDERRALANDPLVQLTNEILGGQVSEIRIGPRSR